MFKNILVPFDGSEQAVKALEIAVGFAKGERARLKVLNVAEMVPVPGAPTATIFLIDQGISRMQELELKKAQYVIRRHGAKADVIAERGHPADSILRFAKRNKTDLIIMGHRGKSGLQRFLLGSVSDAVAHHAHCAVLIVR